MSENKTILFSEPTETISKELASHLANRDYTTLTVNTLGETLLTLQNHRIDALILDAGLLEEEWGFIAVIKGMDHELPIIVCAEENTPVLESRIRQQGIFYYHIKSFGVEDLEMAIANAVNGLTK